MKLYSFFLITLVITDIRGDFSSNERLIPVESQSDILSIGDQPNRPPNQVAQILRIAQMPQIPAVPPRLRRTNAADAIGILNRFFPQNTQPRILGARARELGGRPRPIVVARAVVDRDGRLFPRPNNQALHVVPQVPEGFLLSDLFQDDDNLAIRPGARNPRGRLFNETEEEDDLRARRPRVIPRRPGALNPPDLDPTYESPYASADELSRSSSPDNLPR